MASIVSDGVVRVIPDIALSITGDVSRIISSEDFLALWTVDEYAAAMADKELAYAQAAAMTQRTVNLASPKLAPLLARAVSIGAITQQRADQIAAGTPPS